MKSSCLSNFVQSVGGPRKKEKRDLGKISPSVCRNSVSFLGPFQPAALPNNIGNLHLVTLHRLLCTSTENEVGRRLRELAPAARGAEGLGTRIQFHATFALPYCPSLECVSQYAHWKLDCNFLRYLRPFRPFPERL